MENAENIENRRKRLIYRSWHRGTRELDLIMGGFADLHVPDMEEEHLYFYEQLLVMPDPDVYDWVTGQKDVPANILNPVIEMLLRYEHASPDRAKNL